MGAIESEGFDQPKEVRSGPSLINMEAIYCPNECETESFTIKVNRKPEMMPKSPYIYKIYCNTCGATIVELTKYIDDTDQK